MSLLSKSRKARPYCGNWERSSSMAGVSAGAVTLAEAEKLPASEGTESMLLVTLLYRACSSVECRPIDRSSRKKSKKMLTQCAPPHKKEFRARLTKERCARSLTVTEERCAHGSLRTSVSLPDSVPARTRIYQKRSFGKFELGQGTRLLDRISLSRAPQLGPLTSLFDSRSCETNFE